MKLTDDRIKLNLQFFADPAGEPNNGDNDNEKSNSDDVETKETGLQDEKKYSDADVDRIVGEKYAKFEKQKQKEVDEAKKLAKMNKDEKQKFEMDKLKSESQSFEFIKHFVPYSIIFVLYFLLLFCYLDHFTINMFLKFTE